MYLSGDAPLGVPPVGGLRLRNKVAVHSTTFDLDSRKGWEEFFVPSFLPSMTCKFLHISVRRDGMDEICGRKRSASLEQIRGFSLFSRCLKSPPAIEFSTNFEEGTLWNKNSPTLRASKQPTLPMCCSCWTAFPLKKEKKNLECHVIGRP